MERLDILFVGIAFMFLAGIMYIYWIVGDIQSCFGALRRRLRNSAAGSEAHSVPQPTDRPLRIRIIDSMENWTR